MLPDETLLLENSTKRVADIRVKIIYQIFVSHAVGSMVAMLLAGIPYFYYIGKHESHLALVVCSSAMVFTYIALIFSTLKKYTTLMIACITMLWFCAAGVTGFLSATIYNVAPIQFLAVVWAQSIAVIVYCVHSPHHLELLVTGILLAGATVITLLLSVYSFTVEHDWLAVGVLVLTSGLLGAYNLLAIERTAVRYDASFEQGVRAVSDYFCWDAVEKLGS